MKFFIGIIVSFFLLTAFSYCTKNSVASGVYPASIRIINTYYGKSFSLYQDTAKVLSNIGYNVVSPYAYGSPGYYSLTLIDNSTGDSILTGRTNLQAGTQYSLFTVQDSTQNSSNVNYTLITSNATRPLYDSCRVRFLFFARNFPSTINFYLVSQQGNNYNDTITALVNNSGRSYLDNLWAPARAQYSSLPAILYKFGFYYLDTLQARHYVSQFNRILTKDSLYTFYFEGYYDPTGNYQGINDPLSLKIISE